MKQLMLTQGGKWEKKEVSTKTHFFSLNEPVNPFVMKSKT